MQAKKIGIMTFHNANNYGAALQAYALQTELSRLFPEHPVEVIDYKTKGIRDQRSFAALKKSQGLLKAAAHYPIIKKRIDHIDSFCRERMNLSREIRTREELKQIAGDYAMIVCGSDQVWNRKLTGGEDTYLQDFHQSDARRISYAASFGMPQLPEEWKQDYRELLSRFDDISVREESAQKILAELGLKAEVNVDPTLLLTLDDWKKLARNGRTGRKFVLAYMVPYQAETLSKAQKTAQELGADLVVVCRSLKTAGGKYMGSAAVEEILGLFDGAECVVTNSFHGTAFSLIFHQRFTAFLEGPNGYNVRVANLLNKCGLLDTGSHEKTLSCQQADWKTVEENLARERAKAEAYLKRQLPSA